MMINGDRRQLLHGFSAFSLQSFLCNKITYSCFSNTIREGEGVTIDGDRVNLLPKDEDFPYMPFLYSKIFKNSLYAYFI